MNRKYNFVPIMILVAFLFGAIQPKPAQAKSLQSENIWSVGNVIGLCQGTPIHQGSGDSYPIHTYVPENGWAVKIIGGPRTVNGQLWWDTSRYATGDVSGGTGWIRQDQAGNCPVGGSNTGDDGTDGGTLPSPCTQPSDFTPNIASPEFETPIEDIVTNGTYLISIRHSVQSTARNICKSMVTLPFDGKQWFPSNLKIEWDTGEIEFDSLTLEPKSTQATINVNGQSSSSGLDEYGPFSSNIVTTSTNISSRFDLETQQTTKIYARPLAVQIDPNWAYSSVDAKNLYRKLIAVAMIAGIIGIGISAPISIPAYSVTSLIIAIGMWYTQMTGQPIVQSQQQSSLTPKISQAYEDKPIANYYQSIRQSPSQEVLEALRGQYGDMADQATTIILSPSKTRISAYTRFTFEGSGFSPDSNVLVVFSSVGGNNHLLGGVFHTDHTGFLQGDLEMPDPINTPLGTYLLSAVDEKSMDQALAEIFDEKTNEMNVNLGGALIEVVADTEPPLITINSPAATKYTRCDQPVIAFSVTDDLSGIDWIKASLDDLPVENGSEINMLFINLGQHTLSVLSADRVGNESQADNVYQLKATLPGLSCAIQQFTQMGLISKEGIAKGLLSKVNAAQSASDRGLIIAAQGQLQAFLSLLKAQQGKSIGNSAWQILEGDTNAILNDMPTIR